MKIWMRLMLVAALSLGFLVTEAMVTESTVQAGPKERKVKRKLNKKTKQKVKRVEKRQTNTKKALKRTTKLLQRARTVFAKSGQNKEALYRGAIHQRAARNAYRAGRYNQATHLTLVARRKARKVIQGNKGQLKGNEANDSAEETGAAEEAGSAAFLQDVEKENVPQDALIEMVLKAPIQ